MSADLDENTPEGRLAASIDVLTALLNKKGRLFESERIAIQVVLTALAHFMKGSNERH